MIIDKKYKDILDLIDVLNLELVEDTRSQKIRYGLAGFDFESPLFPCLDTLDKYCRVNKLQILSGETDD